MFLSDDPPRFPPPLCPFFLPSLSDPQPRHPRRFSTESSLVAPALPECGLVLTLPDFPVFFRLSSYFNLKAFCRVRICFLRQPFPIPRESFFRLPILPLARF